MLTVFLWPTLLKCDPPAVLDGNTLGVTFPEFSSKTNNYWQCSCGEPTCYVRGRQPGTQTLVQIHLQRVASVSVSCATGNLAVPKGLRVLVVITQVDANVRSVAVKARASVAYDISSGFEWILRASSALCCGSVHSWLCPPLF